MIHNTVYDTHTKTHTHRAHHMRREERPPKKKNKFQNSKNKNNTNKIILNFYFLKNHILQQLLI